VEQVAQYSLTGRSANEIFASIEHGIRAGALVPGQELQSVRQAAKQLGVSPATVASAYRTLRERGLVTTQDRSRTRVSLRPPVAGPARPDVPIPPSVRDLASGNPDPQLLPPLEDVLSSLSFAPRLYGEASALPELVDMARAALADSDVAADQIAIVSGGLDGIERVLNAQLRPGDRIGVEDPCYTGVLDLVRAMGFITVPVAIDEFGPTPAALRAALDDGIHALIVTPRNQNPTGASLDQARGRELRSELEGFRDILVIEDDHASGTTLLERVDLVQDRTRWALIQSVTKALGPDLRLAILSGDPQTMGRVAGRQSLGCGWVSHILQRVVVALRTDPSVASFLHEAARTYDERRGSLVRALAARGIPASGRSGFNVWIAVPDEEPVVRGLLHLGWAVRGGEAYRISSAPGIRVTTTTITPEEAERFAEDLDRVLNPVSMRTRSA
jgi:DNA-binding transcriptional MocR family regulator